MTTELAVVQVSLVEYDKDKIGVKKEVSKLYVFFMWVIPVNNKSTIKALK